MKKAIIWGLGVVIGAIGGYLYWHFVGCMDGSCFITSSPVNSTLIGGTMGGLLISTFGDSKKNAKYEKK